MTKLWRYNVFYIPFPPTVTTQKGARVHRDHHIIFKRYQEHWAGKNWSVIRIFLSGGWSLKEDYCAGLELSLTSHESSLSKRDYFSGQELGMVSHKGGLSKGDCCTIVALSVPEYCWRYHSWAQYAEQPQVHEAYYGAWRQSSDGRLPLGASGLSSFVWDVLLRILRSETKARCITLLVERISDYKLNSH